MSSNYAEFIIMVLSTLMINISGDKHEDQM